MKAQKIFYWKWGVYAVLENSRTFDMKCQLSFETEYLQINAIVSVRTLI